MASASVRLGKLRLLLAWVALAAGGCRMAPREQVDECHRLNQTLRSENAQLKDQMLALRSQNQDYSERAVDDARRLDALEQANVRLETSVQAYQDERTRLETAYKELRASLPQAAQPLAFEPRDKPKRSRQASEPIRDPELKKASIKAPERRKGAKKALLDEQGEDQSSLPRPATGSPKASRWMPSRPDRAQEDFSSTDTESGGP
ncbi:MAG TPA: hypothetical protein VJY33_07250 [Isosphaeraceae bacterium]|nr:hypothetical protein [Isosphaeraceae bacterium]